MAKGRRNTNKPPQRLKNLYVETEDAIKAQELGVKDADDLEKRVKRGPIKDLTLENVNTKNTFKDANPGLNQVELQNLYTKKFNEFRKPEVDKYGPNAKNWPKGVQSDVWSRFKKQHGELLSFELDATGKLASNPWAEDQAIYKTRFTDSGRATTSAALITQKRTDNVKLLTEASPGTILPLSRTAKQFYNTENWRTKEVHHIDSQALFLPFTEKTLRNLRSSNIDLRKQAQAEVEAFSRVWWEGNVILGDKEEGYRALVPDQHRPTKSNRDVRLDAHTQGGSEGFNYTATESGGTVFTKETKQRIAEGSPEYKAQASKLFYDVTHEAHVENANLAYLFGQTDDRPQGKKPTKVEPGRPLTKKIGKERKDLIEFGNPKSIAKSLMETIQNKGKYRAILDTAGLSPNPLLNISADIVGAVWDGVAFAANPSLENRVDLILSGGQAVAGIAALGLSLVPVPGARPGALVIVKLADAAALTGKAKRLKKTIDKIEKGGRILGNIEQQINRSREGLYTGEGKISKNLAQNVQNRVRAGKINNFNQRMRSGKRSK